MPLQQTPARRRTRTHVAIVVALTLSGALVGCGDNDSSDDAGTTTTIASDQVELTAVDYAFEGVPDSVTAGTMLSLVNESEIEVHEVVAFLLPDGEDRATEELLALPESELEDLFAGPPALVLVAGPGEPATTAVGDGTLEEPGRYVLFCAIPTGADPDEYFAAVGQGEGPPQVDGGPPHFTQGMAADLTVDA